jgi:hypothetical protein
MDFFVHLRQKNFNTERSSKVIRKVEADISCHKEVLIEMKDRIQPILDSLFKKVANSQLSTLSYLNKIVKILNIF